MIGRFSTRTRLSLLVRPIMKSSARQMSDANDPVVLLTSVRVLCHIVRQELQGNKPAACPILDVLCQGWDSTPPPLLEFCLIPREKRDEKMWKVSWGGRRELNTQPSEPQSDALPIELLPPQTLTVQNMIVQTMIVQTTIITIAAGLLPLAGAPYGLPTPMYWNPMARRRDESSRFLVSMMIGRFTRCRILAKSSVRNSGQPVATTRASTPSATP